MYRQFVVPFDGQNFGDQYAVTFSPDGTRLAVAVTTGIAVWEAHSGRLVGTIQFPTGLQYKHAHVMIAFTLDGKRLATTIFPDTAVRFWDVATGQLLATRRYPDPAAGPDGAARVFDPDPFGRRLVVQSHTNNRWSGWAVVDMETGANSTPLAGTGESAPFSGSFSRDGRWYAARIDHRVLVWDADTGAVTKTLAVGQGGRDQPFACVRFSHDGRFLGTGRDNSGGLSVWGLADGELWVRGVNAPKLISSAAFSGDGRTVALGAHFFMYDLLADRPVPEFPAPQVAGGSRCLTPSPDGKWFAFVSSPWGAQIPNPPQTAVYLARFPELPPPVRPGVDLTAAEVDEWWLALTSENRFRREYTEKLFRDRPEQTVAVAGQRLKPALDRDRRRVDDLIANLNDPDPEFRARVAADLGRYAPHFRPRLIAARKDAKDGPAKGHLITALAKTDPAVEADVRGVTVLAGLDSPAARKLLADLAAGAKGATLTEAASAALQPAPPK